MSFINIDNNKYIKNIVQGDSFSYMGVVFDKRLKWNEQLDRVISKVRSELFMLSKISKLISLETCKIIYHAIIASHLTYCCTSWMPGLGKVKMKRLVILQNKCVRTVSRTGPISHAEPLYKFLNILKIQHQMNLELYYLAESGRQRNGPQIFWEMFKTKTKRNPQSTHLSSLTMESTDKQNRGEIFQILAKIWTQTFKVLGELKMKDVKANLKKKFLEGYNSECIIAGCGVCALNSQQN